MLDLLSVVEALALGRAAVGVARVIVSEGILVLVELVRALPRILRPLAGDSELRLSRGNPAVLPETVGVEHLSRGFVRHTEEGGG